MTNDYVYGENFGLEALHSLLSLRMIHSLLLDQMWSVRAVLSRLHPAAEVGARE